MSNADACGILAIWNDCEPAMRADYERWYMRQHLPERIGVPGFRYGRRYEAVEAQREFFTFYEVDDPAVLTSVAYLERLDNPTEWTERIMPHFKNAVRTVCRRVAAVGIHMGGHVVTARFSAPPEAAIGGVVVQLSDGLLPRLAEDTDVCAAQIWAAEAAQTRENTRETALRGPDAQVDAALIVEFARAAPARLAFTDGAIAGALMAAGAAPAPQFDLYQFLCMHPPFAANFGNSGRQND